MEGIADHLYLLINISLSEPNQKEKVISHNNFRGTNMPLSGGDADKVGNRYEDWWTVYCMIDVMDEKAESIRLEPQGVAGFEFWLHKDGFHEYHQVKRQHGKSGRWKLSELENKKLHILSNFWSRLQDPQAKCVFVSTHSAYQLDELSYRASGSASWNEFNQNFLTSKDSQDAFNELCQRWSKWSEKQTYEALKRICVKTISEDILRDYVEYRLNALVDAVPENAATCLIQYAHDEIHHELFADNIWDHLQEKGFQRRHWNNDPHVWAMIDKQNNRYLSRLQQEIIIPEQIIPRDEVQTILPDLISVDGKRGVMISGEAGIGKSNVILQVIQGLQENNLPLLAFRIDTLTAVTSPKELGRQLDLPESPACVLASIANGRKCVLVIDQLDAVSEISGRTPYFFECIYKIITEAQAHRNMRILLACRKFDLNNDYRFRQLLNEEHAIAHVSIARLASERVREIVLQLGVDATRIQTGQT
ncbi:hypothetical protein GF348_21675 [candidate division KSB3 bacterium]|nr:hypothetical protein [candidate division KSB3 bacterium]